MAVVYRLIGIGIVLAVLQDVFQTVLFPASGRGILRKPITALVWKAFRSIALRLSGRRRLSVLAYCGPTVIAVIIISWFAAIVLGFACIYFPVLGHGIKASSGPTDTSFTNAFYYSGFLATTLGTGDVIPNTGLWRVMSIVEASTGFITITMVLTYFLSVYSSLTSRNAFAQGLHDRTGSTSDAARFLARLADGSDLPDARSELASMSAMFREIYQSHRAYPVLRYFHYREPYYALSQMLLVTLETSALCRSALDPKRYSAVIQSVPLDDLHRAGFAMLYELVPNAQPATPDPNVAAEWEKRYLRAVEILAGVGLHIRDDLEAGAVAYIEARSEWDNQLRHLARVTLYQWPEAVD